MYCFIKKYFININRLITNNYNKETFLSTKIYLYMKLFFLSGSSYIGSVWIELIFTKIENTVLK